MARRWLREFPGATYSVFAFALMTNHFHRLLRTSQAELGQRHALDRRSYAVRFNRRHPRIDDLFQGRYKSVPVERFLAKPFNLMERRDKVMQAPGLE